MATDLDPPLTTSELPTLGRMVGLDTGEGAQGETTLVLSGAGYRAALFHLGALTRLNELGLLARVDTIGAVAGGGILAALLASRVPWPLSGAYRDWSERVAEPMRAISRRNARARALLRSPISSRATEMILEERYAREIVDSLGTELPDRPRFVFGAAGLVLGQVGAEGVDDLDWRIGETTENGYGAEAVEEVIAAVRTDLDAFGDAEQAVLENHGYLLADAAVRARQGDRRAAMEPLAPEPPHPRWMDEERMREGLAASSRRTKMGRLRPSRLGRPRRDPQPASEELTALLERWRPFVQYDSMESYRADSVAMIAGLAEGRRCNTLHRAEGELIASVQPAGDEARLSLDFLSGPSYSNGLAARADDYLDECGGSHATDARLLRREEGNADVVYGRAKRDGEELWLQYWFFYYYNDKGMLNVGLHEGDWEMVQLRIGDGEPEVATFGQHSSGESAAWEEIETQPTIDGPVPVVYPARGSHASRLRRGTYAAPTVPDHNDGLGPRVRPRLVTIADDGPAWVLWPGRWGASRRREYFEMDSPRGPREQPQWWSPASFHNEARPAGRVERGEAAEVELPPPPLPGLRARREGHNAIVSYRFPDAGAGEAPAARIVVASYVAVSEEPPAVQSFAVEQADGSVTLQLPPGEATAGVRACGVTELGMPGEAVSVRFE